MSDIFSISISALQAFQRAITVTGNNIANASTPGYSRQSVDLVSSQPQSYGNGWLGSGVAVAGVSRAFDQATATQYTNSQSALGQANALKGYSDQLDSLFNTTGGGISVAVQKFFSAAADVSNDPTSASARQAFLGQAQTLAGSFQSLNSQLNAINGDINTRISGDVAQINSYAQSIAKLNTQIENSGNAGLGQGPNDLLDQRDQLVTKLSSLTALATTTNSNGSINVFAGNGQDLVVDGQASALTTVTSNFDPGRLEIGFVGTGNNIISGNFTGGDLGGLLAARTQLVDPVRNQLGQLATAIAQTVNTQQSYGVDLTGALGKNLFAFTGPQAIASTANTGGASAGVSISNLGALTADSYKLTYSGGAYTLTRTSDGATVPTTGAGTAASPLAADGLNIVLSTTPANGDQFLIQPTAAAAGTLQVALTNTSQIAAAGAIRTAAASANSGSGTISSGTVTDPTNPNLFNTTTLTFTSATTYSVNGAGSFTYTPGGNINLNGWQVQLGGAPAVGDTFTVQRNTGAAGDNRNALAISNIQSQSVLTNGTVSVSDALSSLITGVGTKAQQINSSQAAQSAINTQAQQSQQSVSGVNLDQEAAALLQWQQAYQAAAQALKIGSSLFDTVLAAFH